MHTQYHTQVNGQISLPENLADNGGLHASFQVSSSSNIIGVPLPLPPPSPHPKQEISLDYRYNNYNII